MGNFENVQLKIEGKFGWVMINRPQFLNALNEKTIKEIRLAIEQLEKDSSIRVIIITGTGEKSFVAGADIKEFANYNTQQGKSLAKNGQDLLFDYIENLSKPIIAAVNGYALGGGLELAMACHFRTASENALFGLPEVSLGLIPGYGGTQRLTQLIGKGRAMEMILSAKKITAEEAFSLGLVNLVTTQHELHLATQKIAEKITHNSPLAIQSAIEAVNSSKLAGKEGFLKEIELFGNCFGTSDFKEGTSAFLEKRKPNF